MVLRGPGIVAAISAIDVGSDLPMAGVVIAVLPEPTFAGATSRGRKAVMDGGAGITAVAAGLAARFIGDLCIGVLGIGVSQIAAASAGPITETADSDIDLLVTRISRDTAGGVSGLIEGSRSIARSTQVARTGGAILEGTKPVSEELPAVSLEWDA